MSEELKPCPFCGAGETRIDEARQWQGIGYSEPISVSVRHWCVDTPGQPKRMIERIGRDHASAVAAWNRRTVSGQGEEIVSEREEFDAWFQRRYSCSNFNGSWEATAAMGHAWNGWQERARRTVSGQEAIYQIEDDGAWVDVSEVAFTTSDLVAKSRKRIVYAAPIPATELLNDIRGYLQCVVDSSMSRNNAMALASELIEQIDKRNQSESS